MAVLRFWDGAQYVDIGTTGGSSDEVGIQAGEPAAHPDIWIDTDEPSGPLLDQATADPLYINLPGDAMTGVLALGADPMQPLGAATKQYVDQVITVSTEPPSGIPVRDNLLWMQVGPTPSDATITMTYVASAAMTIGFTVEGAYTVDWGDGSAVESLPSGSPASHQVQPGTWTVVIVPQVGSDLTSFTTDPGSLQPEGIVFDAPRLASISMEPWNPSLKQVDFLSSPALDSYAELFSNQWYLTSVTGTVGSSGTDFDSMFYNCSSLTTVPQLDTSSGTNFFAMFQGCYALTTVPQFDTSSGTNFFAMFQGCTALTTIPLLDTSSGTIFSQMFDGCTSLTTVPQLDTSSGTSFNGMFQGCTSMITTPLLNTSSGTDFSNTFNGCTALTTVSQLDTSSGVGFNNMFNGCAALTTVSQFDTSSGTSFNNMFQNCAALTTIPQLDTSSGTNFSYMFADCDALTAVPQLNVSNGTNFVFMFSACYAMATMLAHGFKYSVSVTYSSMDAAALNTFFTNLGTAAGAQTVDITGTSGAATCDRSIATAKGWTVNG